MNLDDIGGTRQSFECSMPGLSFDEIDEVLYLVRVNEVEELQTYLNSLAQQHGSTTGSIITRCIDPESGNTVLHFCAANGFAGG